MKLEKELLKELHDLARAVKKMKYSRKIKLWLISMQLQTWGRIEMARRNKGFKIYETTLTQNLIYSFLVAAEQKYKIRIFEAKDETKNGNDLEFYIQIDGHYYFFPTQCKIIKKNNKYTKLNHRVKEIQQFEHLRNYAVMKRGLPLYFFYNYYDKTEYFENILDENLSKEMFGITYGNALKLAEEFYDDIQKKWRTPNFEQLHTEICHPLHEILDFKFSNIPGIKMIDEASYYVSKNHRINPYSLKQIENDIDWFEINPLPSIGKPSSDIESRDVDNRSSEIEFNPKFRIMITKE